MYRTNLPILPIKIPYISLQAGGWVRTEFPQKHREVHDIHLVNYQLFN